MTPKLVCSRNFDPAVFMGDGSSVAEEDDRANDLTVIDPAAITLLTCLEKEEQPTGSAA